mmetsp:Transcript_7920/g.17530  ORF Transcript_7920/g.17530 Transcript_7920/m.17530 type:complete len:273 (+) Transcript_7920:55-873(+)
MIQHTHAARITRDKVSILSGHCPSLLQRANVSDLKRSPASRSLASKSLPLLATSRPERAEDARVEETSDGTPCADLYPSKSILPRADCEGCPLGMRGTDPPPPSPGTRNAGPVPLGGQAAGTVLWLRLPIAPSLVSERGNAPAPLLTLLERRAVPTSLDTLTDPAADRVAFPAAGSDWQLALPAPCRGTAGSFLALGASSAASDNTSRPCHAGMDNVCLCGRRCHSPTADPGLATAGGLKRLLCARSHSAAHLARCPRHQDWICKAAWQDLR